MNNKTTILNKNEKSPVINEQQIIKDVLKSLEEDVGSGDITGLLIDEKKQAKAQIITREKMLLSGIPWAEKAFHLIDPDIVIKWHYQDGDSISAHSTLCHLEGVARNILSAERTALNFIQTLSGTATRTQKYVKKLSEFKTILLDTRKTLPGLRYAQKYAVLCGGGKNHRQGLFDAFLIKENHIMACGSITDAIHKARALFPDKKLEIEVETLNELHEALEAAPDVIMLDNFDLKKITVAMQWRKELQLDDKIYFEVSGNITLENIEEYAQTGVDYISTGAITKHIKAIDLTLLFE